MKVLKESEEHINIFKQPGWINLSVKSAKLAKTDDELEENLITESIYTDIEVKTCFKVPNDPNRTVYEIDRFYKDQNGDTVAIFGSHGHEFHTEYEAPVQVLKDAVANGDLEIVDNEQEKQDLRKY